jgi:regulator of RNase E activity RraA
MTPFVIRDFPSDDFWWAVWESETWRNRYGDGGMKLDGFFLRHAVSWQHELEDFMKEILTADELNLLRKFDTPTVCNVIELFDARPRNAGFMDERIQAEFPELPPMVGYASTATFRSADPPVAKNVHLSILRQLEKLAEVPEPRVVVYQDLDNPTKAATFGEVLCTTYEIFGCVGLITSGTGRDLSPIREMRFPVFTSGSICSHGYCQIVDINIPVHVGGVTVHPGDLLHGDCNGVTTIPREIASEVCQGCAQFGAMEAELLKSVHSAGRDLQAHRRLREDWISRVQALRDQLQSGKSS